jgi:beta-lactamase regulating signal transducer with metallopeptidase domain
MSAELISVCDRLITALLNSVYQGTLLAAFVWLCLRLLPRTNAATRHAVGLATLMIVAILPMAHFRPKSLNVFENGIESKKLFAAIPYPSKLDEQSDAWSLNNPASSEGSSSHPISETELAQKNSDESSDKAEVIQTNDSAVAFPSIFRFGFSSISSFFSQSAHRRPTWPISVPENASLVVVGIWLVLSGALLMRLLWQFCTLCVLRKQSAIVSQEMRELFERLCVEQRMKRPAKFVLSRKAEAPMVAGFWRPLVLLPQQVLEKATEKEIQQILRHELAHIRRRDDWANLIQQVIKAIFFFHPAVLWLSRRLTIEREIACDDHVLALGRSPRSYALFLTEFAGRSKCRELLAAPAAWTNKSQLKERIDMILDTKRNASPRLATARASAVGMGAALIAVLALYAAPQVVLAGDKNADEQPVAVSETVANEVAVATVSAPLPKAHPLPMARMAITPVPASAGNVAVVTAPTLASVAVAPAPAMPMIAAGPDDAPDKPRAKARRDGGDDSIERRLARLEQLVQKLVAEDKGTKKKAKEAYGDFNFDMKGPSFDEKQWKDLMEKHKAAKLSDEDMAKLKDQVRQAGDIAKRETEKAMREVERAKRDGDRARADAKRAQDEASSNRENFKNDRQGLEQQRRALERQMHDLERQIQRLEQKQQKLEQEAEHQHQHAEHEDEQGPKHKEKQ